MSVPAAIVALAGAGCDAPPPADQLRICELALLAIEGSDHRPAVMSRHALAGGDGVRLVFWRVPPSGKAREPSQIACRFRPGTEAGAESLVSVQTDAGLLGPARLQILKRFGLPAAAAAESTPPDPTREAPPASR